MLPDTILKQAEAVVKKYRAKSRKLALAESCTGGLVAAAITSVSGSSEIFEYGLITYANAAKVKLLGVSPALLKKHGAVSEECARAMANGACDMAKADVALSITGIAGPTGGTKTKPVGLVYIGIANAKTMRVKRFMFKGNRAAIRQQATDEALKLLLKI